MNIGSDNLPPAPKWLRALLSGAFFALVAAISLSYYGYWSYALEPALKSEAASKAGMLAEAHAGTLQIALESAIARDDTLPLEDAVGKILLLQSTSGSPYVKGVRIVADVRPRSGQAGFSDFLAGTDCSGCLQETVLLYGRSGAMIGSATFFTGTEFLREFGDRAFSAFLTIFAIVIASIVLFSFAIHWLFGRLARSEREARSAAEAKSVFLTTMSHEIRTPMSTIIGSSELLGKSDLDGDQKGLLSSIRTAGAALQSLLDDILTFASLDANPSLPRHEPVDLRALASELAVMLQPALSEKPVELLVEVSEYVPAQVSTDPARVRQVLINLLSNAVKFTRRGTIVLSVRTLIDRLIFEVEDTGIGITPEVAGKLFEPFVQGDQAFTRSFGGSGLGLTISYRLVESLGGSIEVSSEPGKGSVFRVDIPLQAASEPQPQERVRTTHAPSPDAPLRILLVEDTRTNRLVARRLLEGDGHTVDEAENGEEAVYRVRTGSRYDVVLMDVQMPVMDGLAACRAIRALKDPERAGVPVVALTAHAFERERQRCLDAGMNEVVTKPFEVESLTALVQRVKADALRATGAPARSPAG